MQRRTLLAALSVAAGSAGCLAVEPPQAAPSDDADPNEPAPDGDPAPVDGGEPTDGSDPGGEPQLGESVRSAALTTTGSDCGGPADDHVHVLARDEGIAIEGTMPAPTPCYTAVLVSANVQDGDLALTFDVASDLAEGESCVQCHGVVEYSGEVTLEDGVAVDAVAVTHTTGRGHREEVSDAEHAGIASIGTFETACANQSPEESVGVRGHDGGYRVDGIRPAPTPCHAATLQEVDREGGTVTFDVGLESTAPADDDGCIECEGAVRYEIAFRPDDPGSVTAFVVDHDGAGRHEITAEDAGDEA